MSPCRHSTSQLLPWEKPAPCRELRDSEGLPLVGFQPCRVVLPQPEPLWPGLFPPRSRSRARVQRPLGPVCPCTAQGTLPRAQHHLGDPQCSLPMPPAQPAGSTHLLLPVLGSLSALQSRWRVLEEEEIFQQCLGSFRDGLK